MSDLSKIYGIDGDVASTFYGLPAGGLNQLDSSSVAIVGAPIQEAPTGLLKWLESNFYLCSL